MFAKPFSEIEFDDIKAFCEEWTEGIRVEYKQEIPNTIPKIVSSFANTLGGILIFGVETNDNNEAKFPIEGMPKKNGFEETINDATFNGIYPPVTPEVKVYDVPDKPGNVVVLVRVNESPEAPHAIQNETKVYIRVGSTTQPTKLADIDRIQYMLKRREKPQELSNRIIDRIEERITDYWSLTSQPVPNLTLIARPLFPYRPLISPSEIYDYMQAHGGAILFNDRSLDFGTRQVIGGVCFAGAPLYQELNEHGIIYVREKLQKSLMDTAYHVSEDDKQKEYLSFHELLKNHFELIEVAKDFYRRCDYLGDIEIKAKMRKVRGERLKFLDAHRYDWIQARESLDSDIPASITCYARDLLEPEKADDVIVNLLGQLLWVFGVRPGAWETKVREMLKQSRPSG